MCCGGIPAQLRLVGVKTTGWILSYGLDFLFFIVSQMQALLSEVCVGRVREGARNNTWSNATVNKATPGMLWI